METTHAKVLKIFSFKRIIIPVIIGISVALLLIMKDKETMLSAFQRLFSSWTWYSSVALVAALCMMVVRDLAYMLRIRLLTDNKLSWSQSFEVIMLWEFASALTPSVVGGSAVAMFIVAQEGISGGRSTAIVLITALLDELFYIVFVPIIFILAGFSNVFSGIDNLAFAGMIFSSEVLFFIGYLFIILLTTIIVFGIFLRPDLIKTFLHSLFKIKLLHRWQHKADKLGDDIIVTSDEMKNKGIWFWAKLFFITTFSWTARFAVVNFLIIAINPAADYFMVYARQLLMWVVLLISPTPGGSGVAEFAFPVFLGDFIPQGLSSALAFLWRLISYYPYFIIGAIVLPVWLRRVLAKHKH